MYRVEKPIVFRLPSALRVLAFAPPGGVVLGLGTRAEMLFLLGSIRALYGFRLQGFGASGDGL